MTNEQTLVLAIICATSVANLVFTVFFMLWIKDNLKNKTQ